MSRLSNASMKILLSSSRNEWFIESGQGLYAVSDQQGIELAVSVLPLRIVDDYKDVEQFPYEGTASVQGIEDDVMLIELIDVAGNQIELCEIKVDETCLCSVDWLDRPYDDGWVGSRSQLELDNIDTYSLKVFAPVIEGQPDKVISIENKTSGSSWNFTVIRGQENTLPLLRKRATARQQFQLSCDAEPLQDSTDTRDLGFVLVDELMTA